MVFGTQRLLDMQRCRKIQSITKRKKNQSRTTNWELTQVLKLAHEDIEIIIISNTDVQNIKWVLEDMKVTQVKLLEIKSTMFEMKDILDGINAILNILCFIFNFNTLMDIYLWCDDLLCTLTTCVLLYLYTVFNCYSVPKPCPTFCDPMSCSTASLPVLHYLVEFAQIHLYWHGDAIQTSFPLSSPSPPALNLSRYQGLLQWVSSSP